MGSRTVRLDEDVYERLKAAKREDETFSEAVDRLLGGESLPELAGLWSDEEVEAARGVLDEVDADATADTDELVEWFERDERSSIRRSFWT